MRKINVPRDYLSPSELLTRWGIAHGTWDLHHAIIKGLLRPCILITGDYQRATMDSAGVPQPLHASGVPVVERLRGWLYPSAGVQVDKFEMVYTAVRDMATAQEDTAFYLLPEPVTLTYIMDNGVVMMADVEDAERGMRGSTIDELSTKERDSLLKLTSIYLASLGYDTRYRNHAIPAVCRQAEAHGISISENTVSKYARMAFGSHPPEYMTRPVAEAA